MNASNLPPRLAQLEAEGISIIREVAASFRNPVLLYSIGKDSTVVLHLAMKAFFPGKPPFPLMHIATGWDFREMLEFRERRIAELGLKLIVHSNPEGIARGIGPISHGSAVHMQVNAVEALKQGLSEHQFDAAIGGARRDEEKSRAKERIFSFRDQNHSWEPRQQRPELWNLFNTRVKQGESIRAFPISNWTEFDVWDYIRAENNPIVPLYLSAPRPVVRRSGQLIMVDDARLPLEPGEVVETKVVRFRTMGCYPLTGATESDATTLDQVIAETRASRTSERDGRLIDKDDEASMEKKKRDGYF
ncbi:MAG: sulfate adenylyltransferase subunit CysD [Phycisphaerales bacterium]|nr:sulfate adenylyltransferase subunit CysD [Phycisphaerales bacterium]